MSQVTPSKVLAELSAAVPENCRRLGSILPGWILTPKKRGLWSF